MQTNDRILFQEISADAAEFLHELSDPDLVRNGVLSPEVTAELRRQQMGRLRQNMAVLRARQEDFNRKMDEYVDNLARLIRSLEKTAGAREAGSGGEDPSRTRVCCLECRQETVFDMEVLFARESDESLVSPTQCYVSQLGKLKKGVFHCSRCGGDALRIRSA